MVSAYMCLLFTKWEATSTWGKRLYFGQKTTKKRVGGCPAVKNDGGSNVNSLGDTGVLPERYDKICNDVNTENVTNNTMIMDNTTEVKTRFVYNSKVVRKNVEGLLAKPNRMYYVHKNRKQVYVPGKMNKTRVAKYLHCTRIVRSTNCSNTKCLSNSSKKCDLSFIKGVNTTTIAASPTFATDNTRVNKMVTD